MVAAGEYGPMPRAIADAARELELRLASKVDPRDISTSLDKAYYEYAASCRDAFVREYFAISADFQNIITMLRMKRNGENAERFEAYMLPAGRLTAAVLQCAGGGDGVRAAAREHARYAQAVCRRSGTHGQHRRH